MLSVQRLMNDMLYLMPAILISLTVHEYSHARAAYALGDPTAFNAGRLTLSPFSHLDPIGTLCLLFFRFGWAKPVPVNPLYFRNRKRGMAITALAGPASNILLGFLCLTLVYGVATFFRPGLVVQTVVRFLTIMTGINVGLAVFNLLPIAPLDGAKILFALLPNHLYNKMLYYERMMQPIMFILLMTGILSRPLSYLQVQVVSAMHRLLRVLFFRF